MSDTYWSTYVQTSEELYRSRALRFREDNQTLWLNMIGVRDGMRVLEVGCGGGLFCHRIKSAVPGATLTGLDLDEGHIDYAAAKAGELGLDISFVAGDACGLPFDDSAFDLCYSHTVMNFCDPDRFASEQYRVLAGGGRMVAMDVLNVGCTAERWVPRDGDGEKQLFDRLWAAASKNELSNISRHSDSKRRWAQAIERAGFTDISLNVLAVMSYCPDSADTGDEIARAQIEEDRLSELSSVEKARRMAPEALTAGELEELRYFINRRYDERLAKYGRGERLWDYGTSTVLAVTGWKEK